MEHEDKLAKVLRYITRTVLLIISVFWFIFALLSGAEELGGGIIGIVRNSPNALPWLLLFVFVFVAWKWERIGGTIITAMGLLTIFLLDSYKEPFVFLLISLPLMILGSFLIISWYLTKEK